jgi:hypothetical protein
LSVLQWIAAIVIGYVVLAAFLAFAIDNIILIAIPFFAVSVVLQYIRRPAIWRLTRAVRSLRHELAERVPAIIETRTMEWAGGTPTVYLVCRTDSDKGTLGAQLDDIRTRIVRAAADCGVPAEYLSAMRLWIVSRPAVDREGGWFGFDRNVPYRESDQAGR